MFLSLKFCLVCFILVSFATHSFAIEGSSGRLIPTGKVCILKDGNKVGAYSLEALFPGYTPPA